MPIVTDNYKLSLTQDDRVIRIRCSQNDTSRQVNFTIYNNGMPFTIPSGLSVSVRGIKQNGNIFSKSCTYSGSVVTLVLGSQITNVAGISVAELVFTDSSGGKIGTSNFIFQVESDPLLKGKIGVTEETPTEYISDLVLMIEALSARVNNIVAPEGEASLSEVVDARLSGYSGETYQNLKARIDADFVSIDNAKANKVDVYTKDEVDAAIDNVKPSTEEIFSTLINYDEVNNSTGLDNPTVGMPISFKSISGYVIAKYTIQQNKKYRAVFTTNSTAGTYGAIVDSSGIVLELFGIAPKRGVIDAILKPPQSAAYIYIGAYCGVNTNPHTRVKLYEYNLENIPHIEPVPMSSWVQGKFSESGNLEDDDHRVSQSNLISLPYGSYTRLVVFMPDDYICATRSGPSYNNLNNNQFWFASGEFITFNKGDNYFVLCITKKYDATEHSSANSLISPTDLGGVNISVYFYKENEDENILMSDRAVAVGTSFNVDDKASPFALPLLLHISDIHGDFYRTRRFLDLADKIHVDCAILSGDFVANNRANGLNNFDWLHDEIKSHNTLSVICPGNHDLKFSANTVYTDENLYTDLFEPVASKIGNTTLKTWYYVDIPEKFLRVISINLYQNGGETRNRTHFTNEQLSWLCDTLINVPDGYGVVITMHAPQTTLAMDSMYTKFWQTPRVYASANVSTYSDVTGDPIADIVDAFISRTSISQTYAQKGSPSSVSVLANFSTVDSSIEFICYITGHTHQDGITYVRNTVNKQLMINITCAIPAYGLDSYKFLADCSDLARAPYNRTMDAITAYGIDRQNKTVKIARIGADLTHDFKLRDFMIIPYADN